MDQRFDGCIAGLGTAAGLRAVIGHWPRSPFGAFTDVMVERPDGHRVLLAPNGEISAFVAATYRFDEVRCGDVETRVAGRRWLVRAGPLVVEFDVAGRPPLGRLLRLVPRRLATAPPWITAIDIVARRVLPGVRTRGSAGGGRREYCRATDGSPLASLRVDPSDKRWAALDLHRIGAASLMWDGVDQGALAPVEPPVRFGFGSTPREPSLVRVVTLVRS